MNILHNGAISLYHGDCLDVMHEIPDGSVDTIICDLPYGKTSCAWDVVIPFDAMWIHLKRIIKPRGAIVLFGSQPFTSTLIMSNVEWYRHQWVWNKNNSAGFVTAKHRPLVITEDICVFGNGAVSYYPQMEVRGLPRNKSGYSKSDNYNVMPIKKADLNNEYYPKNLINIGNASQVGKIHPTQKPVALLEYLIRTYTNPDETVLDFTFGSCSAGVAALTTKRRFIGIERDATYYALGVQRVQTAIDNLPPMDV